MVLLTVSDVARRLGVASETVRLWSNKGRLKPLRTNSGQRLFLETDIQAFESERPARG